MPLAIRTVERPFTFGDSGKWDANDDDVSAQFDSFRSSVCVNVQERLK